ncbi:hypothetical protein V1498_03180 [Peribacillus sp. SCS-26]|uniref:hypothetical protein n=1 Tax=Paraperibacillus marinus TaxID=3115295 RepID=UPI0039069ACB
MIKKRTHSGSYKKRKKRKKPKRKRRKSEKSGSRWSGLFDSDDVSAGYDDSSGGDSDGGD